LLLLEVNGGAVVALKLGSGCNSSVLMCPAKPHGNAHKEIPSQCEYKSERQPPREQPTARRKLTDLNGRVVWK